MSISVQGQADILRALEAKLGKSRTTRVVNKALRDTGDDIVELVKESVAYYQKTGATHNEVVKSGIKGSSKGIKEVDVGWRGDKDRWRLVHLNEFGYTRFGKYVRPRGMGAVQRAADKSKEVALKKMKDGLEELGR